MSLRTAVPLTALALLTACAGFMDSRQLPMLPMTSRAALGEERIFADNQLFTLRRYAETREGMGAVTAYYVVGRDADHGPRRLANGVEVYTGTVNSRLFFTNFPGEWYCGQSRAACMSELEPEQIPLQPSGLP